MATNIQLQDFAQYKRVFKFVHPEDELKGWITADNFTNTFKEDWETLMNTVDTIESMDEDKGYPYSVTLDQCGGEINYDGEKIVSMDIGYADRKEGAYYLVLEFIEYIEKQKHTN